MFQIWNIIIQVSIGIKKFLNFKKYTSRFSFKSLERFKCLRKCGHDFKWVYFNWYIDFKFLRTTNSYKRLIG